MSFFEVSKLQSLAPKQPVNAGEGAQAGKTVAERAAKSASGDGAKPGVAVEVADVLDAGEPPVSTDRVAEIRAALRDGSYPLVPTKIVDAMIAARVSMGLER